MHSATTLRHSSSPSQLASSRDSTCASSQMNALNIITDQKGRCRYDVVLQT